MNLFLFLILFEFLTVIKFIQSIRLKKSLKTLNFRSISIYFIIFYLFFSCVAKSLVTTTFSFNYPACPENGGGFVRYLPLKTRLFRKSPWKTVENDGVTMVLTILYDVEHFKHFLRYQNNLVIPKNHLYKKFYNSKNTQDGKWTSRIFLVSIKF